MKTIDAAPAYIQLLMKLHHVEYWDETDSEGVFLYLPDKGRTKVPTEMLNAAKWQTENKRPAPKGSLEFPPPSKPKMPKAGPPKVPR